VAKFKVLVIGGSAGSFSVITDILEGLPKNLNVAVILCLHRLKDIRHGFVEALETTSKKQISEPHDKETLKTGCIYLAPSNYHLGCELNSKFALSTEEQINFSRPSIDLTFESFSYTFKEKMIGIILSGANKDGAKGIAIAKKRGATTLVQDPIEAQIKTMPEASIKLAKHDYILDTKKIILKINSLLKEN
jgi:two-component system, chemotaxis family, protein-glutamate methylesterase/glutaminase